MRVAEARSGGRSKAVTDRHVLESRHQVRRGSQRPPRRLDRLEARHQLAEERAARHAGQVRAEAEVLADPEAQVSVGVAVEAKLVRRLEDLLVAIGRCVEEHEAISLADLLPAQLVVAAGGPDQEAKPLLNINLDELSTGHMKGVVLNFPHLRKFIQEQLDSMNDGLKCHVLSHMDAHSDHYPFAEEAIDASILWRWRFWGW